MSLLLLYSFLGTEHSSAQLVYTSGKKLKEDILSELGRGEDGGIDVFFEAPLVVAVKPLFAAYVRKLI